MNLVINGDLFQIVELMDHGEGSLTELEKTIVSLTANQKDSLLRYSATWNTNSRHCHQAQVNFQFD